MNTTFDRVKTEDVDTLFGTQTKTGKDEWLTPPEIVKALGPFDLDPCSPIKRPWPTAARHFTILDNGLLLPWEGRVWCNHCNSFKGCTNGKNMVKLSNENLLDVQTTETSGHNTLSSSEGNGKRTKIELSGLREISGKNTTGTEKGRPSEENQTHGRKETASTKQPGQGVEAQTVLYGQSQAQTKTVKSPMEMDNGGLAEMQGSVGSQVRLLRDREYRIDSRSLHPTNSRELSGHNPEQYGSSLHEVQYEQATSLASCVDEEQKEACPDCGLPAFHVIKKPRVFCNPPYGTETARWLARCAEHGNAIALTFARTETKMFFESIWNTAAALLFFSGRLKFHHVNGQVGDSAGAPSVLIAYGQGNVDALINSGLDGKVIRL